MKNIFLKSLALFLVIATGGCNWIDPDFRINPNAPNDVAMSQILPSAEASLAYIQGGDFGRYASLWTQHHAAYDRQHLSYDQYQLKENDVDNAWNAMYATVLSDLKTIREKAEETGSPHYAGIAKTLTAVTLAMLVDLFDDIPYSEALDPNNLKPGYDTGAEVYLEIESLLKSARDDFGQSASSFRPGADDLIYGGNRAKWTAAVNTLLARYYLRLSDVNGASAYANALAALDAGAIASNAGNAQVPFFSGATSANPWNQFESQRGDVGMSKFFIDMLLNTADPRIAAIASKASATGTYVGHVNGTAVSSLAGVSHFGAFFGSENSPIPMTSYAEAKFIEAEAAFQSNNKDRAATAHNDAVKASLAYFGTPDPAFETAQASETAASITLEKIMTHKYIALYSTLEPFADWRRTGFPVLTPATGAEVARRFPNAQSERLYNNDNYVRNKTVFDRVFWDRP